MTSTELISLLRELEEEMGVCDIPVSFRIPTRLNNPGLPEMSFVYLPKPSIEVGHGRNEIYLWLVPNSKGNDK